ncbi:hypothetical protein A9Z42_0021980 [Trichoderma parareesei]|uniref:Uncharacterized protein n=1 Tax=Trichoderma parareesei TaxID=858221 RepID=A0A2H2Z9S0_TRIPA|nr:hypothetical protein A9Z42_0021980 [Trichoderma parareesei]
MNETRPQCEWPVTRTDHITGSPSQEDVPMSFYDDEDDDDDILSSNEDEGHFSPAPLSQSLLSSFEGYSLPRHGEEGKEAFLQQDFAHRASPKVIPSRSNMLDTPIEAGLDEFVSTEDWH